nr:uncharacterized protein LOC129469903 isoform X1 [Symphalangus syndactylus]
MFTRRVPSGSTCGTSIGCCASPSGRCCCCRGRWRCATSGRHPRSRRLGPWPCSPGQSRGAGSRAPGEAMPQEDADNLPVMLGEPEKEQRVQQLESELSKKRKKCQSLEQEAGKKQRRYEELELQLREAQNWWRRSPGSVGEPQRRSRYHFRPGGVGECGAEGPAPGDDTGEGLSPSQEPGPAEQAGEPGGSAEAPSGGGPAAAAAGGGA